MVPAHLKNNIEAGPSSFRRAFSFLTVEGEPSGQPKPRRDDLQTLLDAEKSLEAMGAIAAKPGLVSKTNRAEVLARRTDRCRGDCCASRMK